MFRYQEQCEKSDLWGGLTAFLAYLQNDEGMMLVNTGNVYRTQKCKLTDNPEAHKWLLGGYIHDMKCQGKSNPRLDALGYFECLPSFDLHLYWENATRLVVDLMTEESKTTDIDLKLILWKKILDRLIILEDLVSYTLLKQKLREVYCAASPDDKTQEEAFNPLQEMRAILQNQALTHCLSARRFDTLCGFYPEIKTIVFLDKKLFTFVTKKFQEDYMELTKKSPGSMYRLYQPDTKCEQSPESQETISRVPFGMGEFGGLL